MLPHFQASRYITAAVSTGEQEVAPLAHYFWVLKHQSWKILAFVLIAVLATIIISYRLSPLFESTATVEIDSRVPSGAIGADSDTQAAANDTDQFLATQVKLLQSDSVIRPVVQRFDLPAADLERQESRLPTTRTEDAPMVLKRLRVSRSPGTYILLVSYRSVDPQLAADVANGVVESYINHVYSIRYEATANLSSFLERQME